MIIYSVTIKLLPEIHTDWIQWMNDVHIPDVMKTGFFIECRMCKVLQEDETEGVSYNLQYLCGSYSELMEYQEKHAPALQADHTKRYKDKFLAFRTLLKLKGAFRP